MALLFQRASVGSTEALPTNLGLPSTGGST
jgi:hypothetical protein